MSILSQSVVLFDATQPRVSRQARRFGAGLFSYVPPGRRVDHTAADEAEYAQMLADEAEARRQAERDFDLAIEERYQRSRELDRVSRGPIL